MLKKDTQKLSFQNEAKLYKKRASKRLCARPYAPPTKNIRTPSASRGTGRMRMYTYTHDTKHFQSKIHYTMNCLVSIILLLLLKFTYGNSIRTMKITVISDFITPSLMFCVTVARESL